MTGSENVKFKLIFFSVCMAESR